jgi:hypothetical protein
MTLAHRYCVGTKIGENEGRVLFTYHSTCAFCDGPQPFTTRAVADGTHDAEIEVCNTCLTVKKYAGLN